MPNPPPRKRIQIHLSTAIVMMFVAGGLIWANTIERFHWKISEELYNKELVKTQPYICEYGWPLVVYSRIDNKDVEWRLGYSDSIFSGIGYFPIAINVLLALSVLYLLSQGCEWLIRRREARKES